MSLTVPHTEQRKPAMKSLFTFAALIVIMSAAQAQTTPSIVGGCNGTDQSSACIQNQAGTVGNQQGQHQGQGQTATGGAAHNAGNAQSVTVGEGQTATGGAAHNAGNAQSVTVGGDTYQQARIPVATAYAPALAASNGTCLGSGSFGAQGGTFGLSIGGTTPEASCDMRYDAYTLQAMGMQAAAVARLCQKAEIAEAMATAGTPCRQPAATQAAPNTHGTTDAYGWMIR